MSQLTEIAFTIKGITPLSWSRFIETPRVEGETPDQTDERIWRSRVWATPDGQVYVPGDCLHKAIVAAAGKANLAAPGKGNYKLKGFLESGIMVADNIPIGVHVDQMDSARLHVPSDGKRGGGKRVIRRFPIIHEWGGQGRIIVLDEYLIKQTSLIKEALTYAGTINGLGRWRPQRGGQAGRFEVVKFAVVK